MSILERSAAGDRVLRGWEGRTVVCIASGPSVTKDQLELVRAARERDAVRVIVVNDMYLVAPWADVLYFADGRWFRWQKGGVAKSWPWMSFRADEVCAAFAAFQGEKVTIRHPDVAQDPAVFVLSNGGPEGLSETPGAIKTGANSGYQALNIAVLAGGNPILLLGFDMRFDGNRSHSHSGHEIRMSESAYKGYAKNFSTLQRPLEKLGVKVINCTPRSEITAFPKGDIASLLPDPRAALV